MSRLPPELAAMQEEVHAAAVELGLDFPEVVFELVDADEMNMFAAYGGFPVRYPHWRFGMEYQQLQKQYEYGLSKIYELVVNNDPCYAFLMRGNSLMEQKLVMAHVYGHADFFRNNAWFAPTDRHMLDTMANHATRVRRYVDRQGASTVERFLDACLSLENLIDPMSLYVAREEQDVQAPELHASRLAEGAVRKFPVQRSYMDRFMNPPEEVERQKREAEEQLSRRRRVPSRPRRDVLAFLLQYAPLEAWQADCLSIVREEAYYYAPQRRTKILNEGWASWCHSRLMATRLVRAPEVVDYAELHAGTTSRRPGSINPYHLGLTLLRDVAWRWDTGRHGKAWEACDSRRERAEWDTGAGDGLRKLFEVRRVHDDLTFLDAFLTPEFIEAEELYTYKRDPKTGQAVVETRDPVKIKARLLRDLTNSGQPRIDVVDANAGNRGELLLVHDYDGVPLREDFARETLKSLQTLWSRPVHLDTVREDEALRWTHDGKEFKSAKRGAVQA